MKIGRFYHNDSLYILVLLFVLPITFESASAQYALTPSGILKGTGADIYGPGHRYHLEAPKNWTVDTEAAKDDGLGAVFYPDGSSWQSAPVVMYSRIVEHTGKTFSQVIDGDLKAMAHDSSSFRAIDRPAIISTRLQTAVVKDLTGEPSGQLERVAYFEEKHWVVLIVLVARNEADLKSSVHAFEALVKSYRYISDGSSTTK